MQTASVLSPSKPFSLFEEKAASERRRAQCFHNPPPSHRAPLEKLAIVVATEAKTGCDTRKVELMELELEHWPGAISYFSGLLGKPLTEDGVRLILEEGIDAGVEAASWGPLLRTRCAG